MKKFDVIVIGAGSGLNIADQAAREGLKVALVENGPMGGTCLNRGCIPSKMLIHTAGVAETIRTSARFGIDARIRHIAFARTLRKVSGFLDSDARRIEAGIRKTRNLALFKTEGRFTGPRTIKAGKQTITGDKIFIFAGTRPLIPQIRGLEGSGYLTSTEALRIGKLPGKLAILGGGYIAAELAHFFGALGSKITIIEKDNRLLPNEDTEISDAFTEACKKCFTLILGSPVKKVQKRAGKFIISLTAGKQAEADQLLVAAGRIPNSDRLDAGKAGIELNERGFIKANDFLETTAKGVRAGGDIAGKYQFKHSANLEAQYAYHNAFNPGQKRKVDYYAMPHAVFSSPQVAGVGMREKDIKKGTYLIGKYFYRDTGMGAALQDENGFVKIIADRKTRRILGCHIIGPEASTLIQEVVVAMKAGNGTVENITNAVHIHPALPEVVQRAANNIGIKD